MQVIIALENPEQSQMAKQVLDSLSYSSILCTNRASLEKTLREDTGIVICNMQFHGEDMTDLPLKYPSVRWIVQGCMSWATATELSRLNKFSEIIPDPLSYSNLYEAILSTPDLSIDATISRHAYFRWLRLAALNNFGVTDNDLLEKLNEIPSYNNGFENVPHDLRDLFFRRSLNGAFSNSHFASIFYSLTQDNKTGTLHLWRNQLHWIIAFESGIPFDIEIRDPNDFFGVFDWSHRQKQYDSVFPKTPCMSRKEYLRKEPQSRIILKSWLTSMLLEVFTWPEAMFEWRDDVRPPKEEYHPDFSREDLNQIFTSGIFEKTPLALIFEVTQSCLSYFLKLKDNGSDCGMSLPDGTKAVVEQLKKGDTLTEMLAVFPSECPVHQVVYFFFVMNQLELIA